ncbi:MAG: hypothetical protein C4617_04665 [Candidatus Liberibacter europaeus]|uniref:Uncharacterized protein n=1 Tax=Candidatus Liberibacter europaeus TaxID=744859 RepID=A0A2T4VWZ8_9HYPH|nr:MAG: hypothetical protein C4617_04665 [Candidatus Liberibacter europaeus]
MLLPLFPYFMREVYSSGFFSLYQSANQFPKEPEDEKGCPQSVNKTVSPFSLTAYPNTFTKI